jgi:hypothetical protein
VKDYNERAKHVPVKNSKSGSTTPKRIRNGVAKITSKDVERNLKQSMTKLQKESDKQLMNGIPNKGILKQSSLLSSRCLRVAVSILSILDSSSLSSCICCSSEVLTNDNNMYILLSYIISKHIFCEGQTSCYYYVSFIVPQISYSFYR